MNINPPPLSVEQLRRIDQLAVEQYKMPSICLMENAGCAAAHHIASIIKAGQCANEAVRADDTLGEDASGGNASVNVAVLCGKGNNGGDGFVIARFLQLLGHQPQIVLLADPDRLRGDAAVNWKIAAASEIPALIVPDAWTSAARDWVCRCKVIVDAMLGTGTQGSPRGAIAQAITESNAAAALRVAIDTPSGLDCDSGLAHDPCFRAAHTCTFVASKLGFTQASAAAYLGNVRVLSIGAPAQLLSRI